MTLVLAASDTSDRSDAVVAAAVDLARRIEADVTIISVLTERQLDDMRQSMGPEDTGIDEVAGLVSDALEAQLTRVTGEPDAAKHLVLHGPVSETIVSHAGSVGADFLALGLRNRSRVGKFLMGSDVQQVLLDAPCPILGVPI